MGMRDWLIEIKGEILYLGTTRYTADGVSKDGRAELSLFVSHLVI